MTLHCSLQWDGLLFTAANTVEHALCKICVFKVVQMFENGFPDVERLRASRSLGKLIKAFFNGLWKPKGQHSYRTSVGIRTESAALRQHRIHHPFMMALELFTTNAHSNFITVPFSFR